MARLLGAGRSHPLIHRGLARAVRRPTFEYGECRSGTDHDDVALGVDFASGAQERIPEYLWRRTVEQNLPHVVIRRDFARKTDGLERPGRMNEDDAFARKILHFLRK